MKNIKDKELKEIIQSGNLNFLIGSGSSAPFLSTLGNIEEDMNDSSKEENAKKKYFDILKKSKEITDYSSIDVSIKKTKENYDKFFNVLAKIILDRKLSIINKQINIFTTNFDMFMEDSIERLNLIYNDGFEGKIKPVFDVSNFNKLQSYRSLQFDNKTDVPIFNIIKLHGSMSWKIEDNNIIYGKNCECIKFENDDVDFVSKYDNLPIVNPKQTKHIQTVLNVKYGALLRKYSLELEKENSILFVIGHSLNDEHIKELTFSVLKSNPTLIVIFFSYSKYNEEKDHLKEKEHQNLYVINPDSADKLNFDAIITILKKIVCLDRTE